MSLPQIIVVGGGLSGLSAAHTVLERGGRVLLLDKQPFMGGNSVKATSGINGTLTQIRLGIKDSPDQFLEDTATKGAPNWKASPLHKVLAYESGPAVEWLTDKFGLDLSLVSRLGGHSFPRTHRGKERFPGMTITYALMEAFEEASRKEDGRARFVMKARVTRLHKAEDGSITGVDYEKDGQVYTEHGFVILATGGYGADFGRDSVLMQHRPDLGHLPTTNGEHCTGDGIKMAQAVGGGVVDLTAVQVHPTGLVHPDEPDAKVKFLAAEALRGVGGILLDRDGVRFCDELGRRDYVTGEMQKRNKGPYRLILNGAASKEIEWHCKHYCGRKLMKAFPSGAAVAAELGVRPEVLADTFRKYNEVAQNKSCPFGKKFFHNLPFRMDDNFHVAIVTPVVHYTMGGVHISPEAEIMAGDPPSTKAIRGLYATGELCGGVHGQNRLGGSSLLDCVVFGRVAGATATRHLLENHLRSASSGQGQGRLDKIAGHVAGRLTIDINVGDGGSITISQGGAAGGAAAPQAAAPAPQTAPAAPAAPKSQDFTLADVAKHNKEDDCWVVVNGEVLNATEFLNDHPGGKHAIMLFAGRDASAEFNMLHKPDVVAKFAPQTVIGKLKE